MQITKSINLLRNYADLDSFMKQSKSVVREQRKLKKFVKRAEKNSDLA